MAYNSKNINLGPCKVIWGGVDLGQTKGGVELTMTTEKQTVNIQGFNNLINREYIKNRSLVVKCPLAESGATLLRTLMSNIGSQESLGRNITAPVYRNSATSAYVSKSFPFVVGNYTVSIKAKKISSTGLKTGNILSASYHNGTSIVRANVPFSLVPEEGVYEASVSFTNAVEGSYQIYMFADTGDVGEVAIWDCKVNRIYPVVTDTDQGAGKSANTTKVGNTTVETYAYAWGGLNWSQEDYNVSENERFFIGGRMFTFKNAPSNDYEILIGSTKTATINNTLLALQTSDDPIVKQANYAIHPQYPWFIVATAVKPGTEGNRLDITTLATNMTATKMSGGIDGFIQNRIDINAGAGVELTSNGKPLILRPLFRNSGDYSRDIIVNNAYTDGSLAFSYKVDEQQSWTVDFTAYPDNFTGKLFSYGDLRQ